MEPRNTNVTSCISKWFIGVYFKIISTSFSIISLAVILKQQKYKLENRKQYFFCMTCSAAVIKAHWFNLLMFLESQEDDTEEFAPGCLQSIMQRAKKLWLRSSVKNVINISAKTHLGQTAKRKQKTDPYSVLTHSEKSQFSWGYAVKV